MQTPLSVEKIRNKYPQFEDENLFPDSEVQDQLDFAEIFLQNKSYGKFYQKLVYLFVAHNLVLYGQDIDSVEFGGSGGGQVGIATSKSVDKVSVTYDNSSTTNQDAGTFNLTRYGQKFWWLFEMFGAGGRQL